MAKRPGLYANIHKKRARIKAQKAAGKTPERMRRKPGSKGAPTAGRSGNLPKQQRNANG